MASKADAGHNHRHIFTLLRSGRNASITSQEEVIANRTPSAAGVNCSSIAKSNELAAMKAAETPAAHHPDNARAASQTPTTPPYKQMRTSSSRSTLVCPPKYW